ncbi:MAG: hypothetical protein ABIQ15_02915 [Nocardioides sp.]
MLAALAPARRRLVLAVLGLLVAVSATVVVAVLVRREAPVVPVAQDEPGPVLLVPGYGGSTAGLEVLAAALRDQGREATQVTPVGDGTGDLRAQARGLDRAAQAALDAGATSVDVVGYSAGGVVARLWVDEQGGDALARRVVSLASPQHGTDLAGLASDLAPGSCPVACRQLAPNSDLLRALNAGDETAAGPRWIALWTTDDKTVVPPSSGSLDGALELPLQDLCPGLVLAHGDVPRSATVAALVSVVLAGPEAVLPGREVCAAG